MSCGGDTTPTDAAINTAFDILGEQPPALPKRQRLDIPKRSHVAEHQLRAEWDSAADALAGALSAAGAAESLSSRRAGMTTWRHGMSPSRCRFDSLVHALDGSTEAGRRSRAEIFDDAMRCLVEQGEIFVASGIVYLDPAFLTSLIAPLVDPEQLTKFDERRQGTVWEGLPSGVLSMCRPHVKLLVEKAQLQPALLEALWPKELIPAAHRPMAIELLSDPTVGLLMEQRPSPGRVAYLGDDHYWLVTLRLNPEPPDDLVTLWSPANGARLSRRFELLDGRALPVHIGLAERCIAGSQGMGSHQAIRTWRRGVLLADAGGQPVALLSIEANAIVLDVLDVGGGGGGGGGLLHRLETLVYRVIDEYPGLHWRPAPVPPSNQGYESSCTCHALLKVVIAQLDAKYGVKVDFHSTINQIIEKTDPLLLKEGSTIPAVAEVFSSLVTGLASTSVYKPRYKVRVLSESSDSFEDLKRAVSNSLGHRHIVTGTRNHAIVADSVAGDRVRCLNSHGHSGTDAFWELVESGDPKKVYLFFAFHIIGVEITHTLNRSGGWLDRGPKVRQTWSNAFGTSPADLVERLLP